MSRRNKKGIFFTTDALVALVIVLLVLIIAYPVSEYVFPESKLNEDLIESLSSLSIGDMNSTYVRSLIDSGIIKDTNISIIEQIGNFYVENISLAKSLAQESLIYIDTKDNIGIWYGEDLLASINYSSFENAKYVDVSRQIISGVQKGNATTGFVSRAWLSKIRGKHTLERIRGDLICGAWRRYSWGSYCGSTSNEIIYLINISQNATIKNAFWLAEPAWVGQQTQLYVNGQRIFNGNIGYYVKLNITSYLHPGANTARFVSSQGGEDGASHIVVEYDTAELQTFEQSPYYPIFYANSSAVLHYERSIFVPDEINQISVVLNISKNVNLSLRGGSRTYPIGLKSPTNGLIIFDDSEIRSALNSKGMYYSNLTNEYFFIIIDGGYGQTGRVIINNGSYVFINSTKRSVPFGSIDIIQETKIFEVGQQLSGSFYRYLAWRFFLPRNSIPIATDWQFGWLSISGSVSSQVARANGITLYQSPPDAYLAAFSRFGYSPSREQGVFRDGGNNFTLNFGNNYGVSNEASYGAVTFFVKSFVNYGETKQKAQGGTRVLVFQDDSTYNLVIGNSSDAWDPQIDSIDDAIERLIEQYDFDGDGKLDLLLSQDDFEMDTLDVSGVPYLWSTEVQIRTWR